LKNLLPTDQTGNTVRACSNWRQRAVKKVLLTAPLQSRLGKVSADYLSLIPKIAAAVHGSPSFDGIA
jgi:hypothetical protein